MARQKFYVVWKGRKTGIFDNWEDCNAQIKGYSGAEFISFKTRQLAEEAINNNSLDYIGKRVFESELSKEQLKLIGDPILDSVAVDAAWNTISGQVEYKGVNTKSGKVLFTEGPFEDGTINIAEFLAIVHALALSKRNNWNLPIYSDSRNAIGWVKDKEVRTAHEKSEKNKKLFEMVDRALKWLNDNEFTNQILKWETRAWGENPADFGRK
jgi:ribonuclease HI